MTFQKGNRLWNNPNSRKTQFQKGQISWNKNQIKITCLICDKIFEIRQSRKDTAKFCSQTCHGKSKVGKKLSEEHRLKITHATIGKNNPMYGKRHSEESKLRMRLLKKGKYHPMYGRQHTEETKRKMSLSMTGILRSEETKRKMSLYMKGRHVGIKHPNFKGYQRGYGYDFFVIRKHSLEFYGHRCVECGMTSQKHIEKLKKELGIHHKDGNRKNNTIGNCVPMCVSCHSKQRIHHHKDFEILSLDKFKEGNYEKDIAISDTTVVIDSNDPSNR
jgi:hypothetical protein